MDPAVGWTGREGVEGVGGQRERGAGRRGSGNGVDGGMEEG